MRRYLKTQDPWCLPYSLTLTSTSEVMPTSLWNTQSTVSTTNSSHWYTSTWSILAWVQMFLPGPSEGSECLRATRHDVNPFGPHPQELAQGLSRALVAGHALSQALAVGAEVLNATESVRMARQCGRALVRMLFCPHCRGLTLIRPCGGLCLNVMRGCLAGIAELDGPWRRYVALLERLSGALSGGYEVELALLHIRERINDAILTSQLNGPHLSAVVRHAFLIHRTRLFLFHKWAAPYAGLIRSSVYALAAACSSDQVSRPIRLCSCKQLQAVLLNCYSCMYLNLKLIILINKLLAKNTWSILSEFHVAMQLLYLQAVYY